MNNMTVQQLSKELQMAYDKVFVYDSPKREDIKWWHKLLNEVNRRGYDIKIKLSIYKAEKK